MGVVKTARAIGRVAGKALDREDRELVARGIVLLASAAFFVVGGAGIVGLAVRVFGLAAG